MILRSMVVPDKRSYKYTIPLPLPLRMLQKPDGGLTVLKRTSPSLCALQNPTAASLYYLHFQAAAPAVCSPRLRARHKTRRWP